MELKWKSCLRIGVTVMVLFLLTHYWTACMNVAGVALGAAMPLFLGCVIAYIVNIPMTFIEKGLRKFGREGQDEQKKQETLESRDGQKKQEIQECRDSQEKQDDQKDQNRQEKPDDPSARKDGKQKRSGKNGMPVLQRWRRPVSLVLALISIVLVIYLIIRMIVPELLSCMQLLFRELPGVLQDVMQWLEDNLQISSWLEGENGLLALDLENMGDWQEWVAKLSSFLWSGLGGAMITAAGIVSSVFSTTVTVVVGFIFALYLLAGKEKIGGQMTALLRKYLPVKLVDKIFYVLHIFDGSFHSFIVGQCTEAVVLGLLCIIGMLLLQLPYAAMIGCLVGFTALIPVAGAYIGAVVGAVMIFTVSPVKAVIFIVFLVVLQQLEGNLIYPKVVGSSIGLPGIWVLAAVTVGGGVMGVGGMLLGVPTAAALYRLLQNDVRRKPPKAIEE